MVLEKKESERDGFFWVLILLRDRITKALAMRRKVRVKGNVKMEEEIVWESLILRMVKNSELGGKPAASKRVRRRL